MRRILLADDEMALRMLVRVTIEGAGVEVLEATDGEEALRLAGQEDLDLAVLDWMMPRMTGPEVAARLREDPRTAQLPIVMLSARSQAQDIAEGAAAGADAYLVKPFSPLHLLETIEKLLAEREAARPVG
ncbi:MAG: response regulator [Acidobacteria bacterium]|nr:response regulator [Acidobacteriota bacterium]